MEFDFSLRCNKDVNYLARIPILSTFLGAYRFTVNLAYLFTHLIKGIFYLAKQQREQGMRNLMYTLIDLREMTRGIIEIPPVIGGLASLLYDHYLLSPAQKLAYRIQIAAKQLAPLTDYDKNQLIPVGRDVLAKASSEFVLFVNRQPVFLSTNKERVEHFVKVFKAIDFSDSIFKDPHLPFYALTAFYERKIDAMDVATMMEIYVAKLCHKDCRVYPLLDDRGELSPEAMHYDPMSFPIALLTNPRTQGAMEIRTLPPHKRIFFVFESLMDDPRKLDLNDEPYRTLSFFENVEFSLNTIGRLYYVLFKSGSIRQEHGKDVHLSFDAECERLRSLDPESRQSNIVPRLGAFTARDIKKGVRELYRLNAVAFPGIKNLESVHHSEELPTTAMVHDKGHAYLMRLFTQRRVIFFNHLSESFERVTGMEMTKEIWELTDMVALHAAQALAWENDKEVSALNFLTLILNSNNGENANSWKTLLVNDDSTPTPLGWLAIKYCIEDYEKNLKPGPRSIENIKDRVRTVLGEESQWYRWYEKYKSIYKHMLAEKKIGNGALDIVGLWRLSQEAAGQPVDLTVQASDLKFIKIKSSGERNNTVILRRTIS